MASSSKEMLQLLQQGRHHVSEPRIKSFFPQEPDKTWPILSDILLKLKLNEKLTKSIESQKDKIREEKFHVNGGKSYREGNY